MSDITEGGRVRLIDMPEVVGTVFKLNDKTALVAWDSDPEAKARVSLSKLEAKRGRAPGTVAPTPKNFDAHEYEFVLPEVLAQRMEKLNMSWNAVVEACGVSRPTVARIMRGETAVGSSTIQALAEGLGIDPGKFWRRIS